MNKLNALCIITFLLLCPFALRAEQDAALLTTNAPQITITNLATAVQAVNEISALWPERFREYSENVRQIMVALSQHEDDYGAQEAMKQLFDDVISLQTVYGKMDDDSYLYFKQDTLYRGLFAFKPIKRNPDRWLDLAKHIGDTKEKIKPIDDGRKIRTTKNGSKSVAGPTLPNTQEEWDKKLAEDRRILALNNYQGGLKSAVKGMITMVAWSVRFVEFGDDAERNKFKESFIKFAQLSEEDFERMGENRQFFTDPPPASTPAQATESDK